MKTISRLLLVGVLSLMFLAGISWSMEPPTPDLATVLTPEKEAKVAELKGLSSQAVVEALTAIEFTLDADLMHKAIYEAFRSRENEAINLAVKELSLPVVNVLEEGDQSRHRYRYVAKKIFVVFPQVAINKLLETYQRGNGLTRGNLIEAIGQVGGDPGYRRLLRTALDDENFVEQEQTNSFGIPLRVCDVAYNQLIVREELSGMLRTIGIGHNLDDRDYHIAILKNRLD